SRRSFLLPPDAAVTKRASHCVPTRRSSDLTHFEQIYQRAIRSLNNGVAAFDDAKDVTRLMRSEQDSLAEFQAAVVRQEQAYKVRSDEHTSELQSRENLLRRLPLGKKKERRE